MTMAQDTCTPLSIQLGQDGSKSGCPWIGKQGWNPIKPVHQTEITPCLPFRLERLIEPSLSGRCTTFWKIIRCSERISEWFRVDEALVKQEISNLP